MITGEPPFNGTTTIEIKQAVKKGTFDMNCNLFFNNFFFNLSQIKYY